MKRLTSSVAKAALLATCWFGSYALAEGPVESSCSDDLKISCVSKNPDVLAFRKSQIVELYKELVFPGPIEVLKDDKAAAHIFEIAGVYGRVTPVGKFSDFSGVVEYFYALAANVHNHVYDYKINNVLADEDKVSVNVQLSFCFNTTADCLTLDADAKNKQTLTEIGYFVFNKQNRVIYFDLVIPNLGAAYDEKNPLKRAGVMAGMCAFLTIGHIDPITQEKVKGGTCTSYFDGKEDFGPGFIAVPNAPFLNCMTFMSTLEWGSYNRANSNTVSCRQVHMLLTPLRPETHCPHVAYGGGGKCVDMPYESYYTEMNGADHEHH
ncbi:MAG: hypothetical protein EOP10_00150 [Proteobacteria bacterium]|nr:MAG: hypothetical protein EOP10_00150 [Pseudomonadota bacterium]